MAMKFIQVKSLCLTYRTVYVTNKATALSVLTQCDAIQEKKLFFKELLTHYRMCAFAENHKLYLEWVQHEATYSPTVNLLRQY